MTLQHLSVDRLNEILYGSLFTGREIRIMARVCLFHHPDMFMDGFEGERLNPSASAPARLDSTNGAKAENPIKE